MDEQIVSRLLGVNEGDTVDFKSEQYRLDNDHFKATFLKDIISFANTPRGESAFILLGVKAHSDGKKEILGINQHHDDAILQTLVASKIEPIPYFAYRPVKYGDKMLGLIEIFPRKLGRPFISTWEKKDIQDMLRYAVVYFRHSSSNTEAKGADLEALNKWMLGPDNLPVLKGSGGAKIAHWDEFLETGHQFGKGWLYVLVVGPGSKASKEELSNLARVDWSMIFDFDASTQLNGVYAAIADELQKRRALHILALDDNIIPIYPERATYLVAAGGLQDRPTTLVEGGWREWNRKNARKLNQLVEKFARSASGSAVTVIATHKDANQVRIVCEQLDNALGDAAEFIFADESNDLASLAGAFGTNVVPISLRDICAGVADTLPSTEKLQATAFPNLEGYPAPVPASQIAWLEEELELVHLAVGLSESDANRTPGRDFLRGQSVSWFDLNMHYDVEREKATKLREQIERDVLARASRTIYLRHWPGAGGSTLVRSVLWELHRKYPVVCLITNGSQYTISRLRAIFDLTNLPPIVLIDSSDVQAGTVDKLQSEANVHHLPVVFVATQRTFNPHHEGERTIYLGRTLSFVESHRFAEKLAFEVPERRQKLQQIVETGELWERTPFYLALVAFDKDFTSIEDYVRRRMDKLDTDVQKSILTYIAMAFHYSQKPVTEQVFGDLLGLVSHEAVRLERVLPGSVVGDLVVKTGPRKWRAVHEILAQEILEQSLAGQESDRQVWKQNLSAWSIAFAELCANRPGLSNDETVDLLARIFVLRDNEQLLGTEQSSQPTYSRLIEDVPSQEGRLEILKRLVELFPTEAHYWAHLGRFYSLSMKDHEKAIPALGRALELDPKDRILHHMRGMALRTKAYLIAEDCVKKGSALTELTSQLKPLVEDAAEEFVKSTEIAHGDEHGYISHIQMIIRVVEWGFKAAHATSYSGFLISPEATWYRELLDKGETLLEELRQTKIGQEHLGARFVECRTSLDGLCGEYARVIEGWTNLLGRPGIYQPPIRRQLVRTYLARKNNEWDQLPPKDILRIVDLLEQNLLEEPKSGTNLRLWFEAARNGDKYGIDAAIEKLSYWRANTGSLEASFYLSALYVLKVLEGSNLDVSKAKEMLEETSKLSRDLPNRHFSNEWLGKDAGLRRILNHRRLGTWEDEFATGAKLTLVHGRVSNIKGYEQGWIELQSGLAAFFVPGRGYQGDVFVPGRDENAEIRFFLAFTFDGLRAWSVRRASR